MGRLAAKYHNKIKTILLSLLATITLFLMASYAYAGCCLNPASPKYFCQDTVDGISVTETQCGSGGDADLYDAGPCSGTDCVQQACCISALGCTTEKYEDCSPADGKIWMPTLTNCYDSPPSECAEGCCYHYTTAEPTGDPIKKTQKTRLGCEQTVDGSTVLSIRFFEGQSCSGIPSGGIDKGFIRGVITDDNGDELNGVKVESLTDGSTDFSQNDGQGDGRYFLEISVGTHDIRFSLAGYDPVILSDREINKDEVLYENIVMQQLATAKGTVIGYVYDEDESPVRGARVCWKQCASEAYTDQYGRYVLEGVDSGNQAGTSGFTAKKSGYIESSEDVQPKSFNVEAGVENSFLNFILAFETQVGTSCGNGGLDEGEECDGDAFSSCQGYCDQNCQCIDTCPGIGGYCYDYSFQCENVGGSTIGWARTSAYCRSYSEEGGCCNTVPSVIKQCTYGTSVQRTVGYGIDLADYTQDTGGTLCRCGNGFYNLADSDVSDGYCCYDDGSLTYSYQDDPCAPPGILIGKVLNESDDPIPNARVQLLFSDDSVVSGSQAYDDSMSNGDYRLVSDPGTYSIRVSAEGYEIRYINDIVFESDVTNQLDIVLVKRDKKCDGTIPAPDIELQNVRGEASVKVLWSQECAGDATKYLIYRDNFQVASVDPVSGLSDYEYEDTGLLWEKNYKYKVITLSAAHGRNETNDTIYSGSHLCEGVELGVCLSPGKDSLLAPRTVMAQCTYENLVDDTSYEDCPAGQLCVGPLGETVWCSGEKSCEDKGTDEDNIFGLYYDVSDCLTYHNDDLDEDMQDFCYYDFTQSTIDKCKSCSQTGSCFDYLSEEACFKDLALSETGDNCNYGTDSNPCQWLSTDYSEFGKGICYEEDYSGTDHCSLCSNSSTQLFRNYPCTPDVCDVLGDCYSKYGKWCEPCSSTHRCEDYADMASCIGADGDYNIPEDYCAADEGVYSEINGEEVFMRSSPSLSLSGDSCGLGYCKWGDDDNDASTPDRCYKDANDDDTNDCETNDCKIDNKMAVSVISSKPEFISQKQSQIIFSAFDPNQNTAPSLYYCVASDGESCCPVTEAVGQGSGTYSVTLPNDYYGLQDIDSNIYINYFSIDSNGNVEEIKSEMIYVDTRAPAATVSYSRTDSQSSDKKSDIVVTLSVSEPGRCTGNLTWGGTLVAGSGQVKNTPINDSSTIKVTYSNLDDGYYYYNIVCHDEKGNANKVVETVNVDRIHYIFDRNVNGVVLGVDPLTTAKNPVTLHINSTDDYFCAFRQTAPNVGTWAVFNSDGSGIGVENSNNYVYEKSVTLTQNTYYNYEAKCWPDEGTYNDNFMGYVDTTNLDFTFDNTPPQVSVFFEQDSSGEFVPFDPTLTYKNPTLKMECLDLPDLDSEQEFGCYQVKYCIYIGSCGQDIDCCNPTDIYDFEPMALFNSQAADDYHLCYSGIDKGGNQKKKTAASSLTIADPDCVRIHVDNKVNPINISIESSYGTENLTKLIGHDTIETGYTITVRADELIKKPDSSDLDFKYLIRVTPQYEADIDSCEPVGSSYTDNYEVYAKVWSCILRVPAVAEQRLKGIEGNNSEFAITFQDTAGNQNNKIAFGKHFEVDTKGPAVPVIRPDIANNLRTRNDSLNITGMIDYSDGPLTVYANLSGVYYSTISISEAEPLATGTIADLGDEYHTYTFQIYNNRVSDLSGAVYVQFANHNRTSKERYEIESVALDSSGAGVRTNVVLKDQIQSNLLEGGQVSFYTSEYPGPAGWFSLSLPLTDYNRGNNTLWIYGIDEAGNKGDKYKRKIIYDKYPFEIIYMRPIDGTITGDDDYVVHLVLFDQDSGVQRSSIVLDVNGQEYRCSDVTDVQKNKLYCSQPRTDSNGRNVMDIEFTKDWADGAYNLEFTGKDIVGNVLIERWQFEINSNVPREPEIELPNGIFDMPDTYINSKSFQVVVNFDRSDISVDDIFLIDSMGDRVGSAVCSPTEAAATFTCDISVAADGEYEINVAAKMSGQTVSGLWKLPVVVDTTPPAIEFYGSPRVNKLSNVEIKGRYFDRNLDEYGNDDYNYIMINVYTEEDQSRMDFDDVYEQGVNAPISKRSYSEGTASIKGEFSAVIPSIGGSGGGTYIPEDYDRKSPRKGMIIAKDKAGNENSVEFTIWYDAYFNGLAYIYVTTNSKSDGIVIQRNGIFLTNITAKGEVKVVATSYEPVWIKLSRNKVLARAPNETMEGTLELNLSLVPGMNNLTINVTDLAGNTQSPGYYVVPVIRDQEGPRLSFDVIRKLYLPQGD